MATTQQQIDFHINAKDGASKVFKQVQDGIGGIRKSADTIKTIVAFGGFNEVVTKMAALSAEGLKLQQAFEAGEVSLSKMVEDLAKAVPGIGPLIQTGRNIHEMIAGPDQAKALDIAIAKQNELIKSTQAYLDVRKQLIRAEEDVQAKLRGEDPKSVGAILRGGERRAQDVELNDALKAARERQAALNQEISKLRDRLAATNAMPGEFMIDPKTREFVPFRSPETATMESEIRLKQKQVDDLEKRVRELRQSLTTLIGRETLAGMMGAGVNAAGGFFGRLGERIKSSGEEWWEAIIDRQEKERAAADVQDRIFQEMIDVLHSSSDAADEAFDTLNHLSRAAPAFNLPGVTMGGAGITGALEAARERAMLGDVTAARGPDSPANLADALGESAEKFGGAVDAFEGVLKLAGKTIGDAVASALPKFVVSRLR